MGFKEEKFNVVSFSSGPSYVSDVIINKFDKFKWRFVGVYGTAYADHKLDFFSELHDLMEDNSLPILIGGDFNLIRNPQEKNSDNFNALRDFMFNDWLNKWNFIEFKVYNRFPCSLIIRIIPF
jgi:hypothetical protein